MGIFSTVIKGAIVAPIAVTIAKPAIETVVDIVKGD